MSENKEIDLTQTYSKAEDFINENKQPLTIVLIVLAVIIGGSFYYTNFYMPEKEKEAQSQFFMAQNYFENDSLQLALNGDGNYLGLLSIIAEYGSTQAGNLANYYAGICFLKAGDYQSAIKYLDDFSSDDIVVSGLSFAAMGDAYMEQNDVENAIKYYREAMEKNPNEFSTPILMMKTALALEKQEKYADAKDIYEQLKDKYPLSPEARDIEKYIAKAEAKM